MTTKTQAGSDRSRLRHLPACFALCSVLLLVVVLVEGFTTTFVDIDTNSGRTRTQLRLGSLVLSSRIEETRFSTYTSRMRGNRPPNWRTFDSRCRFDRVHVGYRYRGVKLQLDRFMLLCDLHSIQGKEKERLARTLLRYLRTDKRREMEDLLDKRHLELLLGDEKRDRYDIDKLGKFR